MDSLTKTVHILSLRYSLFLTVFTPTCLSDTHNIYVSVKHNNLLHKIMHTATCFDSNVSSSGHPHGLIQDISYIGVHFGSQTLTNSSKVIGNIIIIIS